MLIFFAFFVWIWLLISVFSDILRRHDISGWGKVGWIVFVIVLPYLGVFVYLIAQHEAMMQRSIERAEGNKAQVDSYVRSVAAESDPAEQIAKAKTLLDAGTITEGEFEQIKHKALATA
jgi:hypothetical protein